MWRVWSDVSLYAQIRAFIEQLVHVSARRDPLTAARHRAFIAPRMIGGLLALTALPVHLAINGVPGPLEIFIYAWLATPLLIACYLSRTGHYERAQIMSSVALAVLVTMIGAATGGITLFRRRVARGDPDRGRARRLAPRRGRGIRLCACRRRVPVCRRDRATRSRRPRPRSRWRCSASARRRFMRPASRSAAPRSRAQARVFWSWRKTATGCSRATSTTSSRAIAATARCALPRPPRQPLFGVPPKSLLGHGLFDRVHVADRPAYLTALSHAATQGASSSVEFRIRREAPGAPDAPASYIWVDMRCRPLDRATARNEASARSSPRSAT